MSRREYVGSFKVSSVSPKTEYASELADLKTIGLKLNYDEAVRLRDELVNALNCSANWDFLNITGYRENNNVTVTYYKPV